MKRLFIIIVLALSIMACANIETRIMDEFPGADQIQELQINYERADPTLPSQWYFSVCYDAPLIGCVSGTGATWEELVNNMKDRYIEGEEGEE